MVECVGDRHDRAGISTSSLNEGRRFREPGHLFARAPSKSLPSHGRQCCGFEGTGSTFLRSRCTVNTMAPLCTPATGFECIDLGEGIFELAQPICTVVQAPRLFMLGSTTPSVVRVCPGTIGT